MSAATVPLSHLDSTATDPTVNFSAARFAFRQLETWLTSDEAADFTEAEVEEQLQQRGREVLRLLLEAHIRQRGSGDVGPALLVFPPPVPTAQPDGTSSGSPEPAAQPDGTSSGNPEPATLARPAVRNVTPPCPSGK